MKSQKGVALTSIIVYIIIYGKHLHKGEYIYE